MFRGVVAASLIVLSTTVIAVEKVAVINEVTETAKADVLVMFSDLKPENIHVKINNLDAIDSRIRNAKSVSVDLLKNDAIVGRRVARVSLYNDEGKFTTYFSLFLTVDAYKESLVFSKNLSYGNIITAEDLSTDLVKIRNKRAKYLQHDLNQVIGKKTAHNNRKGAPVYEWSIQKTYDLDKGRVVKGVYSNGSLEIEVKVEVLESANIGEKVKVKVKPNDKVVYAVVKGKEHVEILSDS